MTSEPAWGTWEIDYEEEHDPEDLIALAVRGRKVSRTNWVRANCPLCELKEGSADKKFSLGFSITTLRYECYRCSTKGRLRTRPEEYELGALEAELARDAVDAPPPPPLELPEGYMVLTDEPARSSFAFAAARHYLRNDRKVSDENIDRFRIGACARGRFAGCVIVPVFDAQGGWAWFVGRKWTKKAYRPYLYPNGSRGGVMFNQRAIDVVTDEPLMVMEGCFDAIAHYPNAVAVLGKTTEEHLALLEQAKRPVVFVPDGDEHESGYALSLRLKLANVRSGAVRLAPKVDPDEVPREVLRAAAVDSLAW